MEDADGRELKVGDRVVEVHPDREYAHGNLHVVDLRGEKATVSDGSGYSAMLPGRELRKMETFASRDCSCPCGARVRLDLFGRVPDHRSGAEFCAASGRSVSELDGAGGAVLMTQFLLTGDRVKVVAGQIRHGDDGVVKEVHAPNSIDVRFPNGQVNTYRRDELDG